MASVEQTEAEQQPAGDTGAVEFGASLREIRLAHQRELSAVSEDLRIRQVFLNAIEDGRFDDLPGPAYAVGFVRAYADYLGLDVEAVVSQFRELGVVSGPQAHLVPPSPVAEGRLPTGSVLLVAAVLAAGAYGGWYYLSLDGRAGMDDVAALPQRIAALIGMRSEPEAPQPAATPAETSKPEEPAAAATEDKTTSNDPEPGTESAPGADAALTAPAEQADQGNAEPTDGNAPPEQGDAGLTATEPPVAAELVESATAPLTAAPETPATAPAPDNAAAPQTPVQETPATASAPTPPPATEPVPEPVVTASAPPEPTPPATAAATDDAASTAPQTASAAPETTFEPQTRITVRATTNAWVEVLKKGGDKIFSRMMQSGEAVDLPINLGMTLSTGNAGGIEILLDGEVRRDVALDATSLRKNSDRAR